jgi:hypothetical protein
MASDLVDDEPNLTMFLVNLKPEHSCSLDVAERGPWTLDEIGKIFNITRERIRQIEAKALRKIGRVSFMRRDQILDHVSKDALEEWREHERELTLRDIERKERDRASALAKKKISTKPRVAV